ncbi:MAG TPA: hypothetical protein VH062_36170 [Polyangiaceae bacterium]|nr:hypothetical protein [Polyangiaceae bacterium]
MKSARERSGSSATPASGRLKRFTTIAGFSAVLLLAASGCVATLGTDADYAYADDVPPDVTTYPHTNYEGRDVYLVNDRYYYRGPQDRWVYYRSAPRPLVERRSTFVRERPYVQRAPAVRRAPERRVEERRVAPGVRGPEPATQVR